MTRESQATNEADEVYEGDRAAPMVEGPPEVVPEEGETIDFSMSVEDLIKTWLPQDSQSVLTRMSVTYVEMRERMLGWIPEPLRSKVEPYWPSNEDGERVSLPFVQNMKGGYKEVLTLLFEGLPEGEEKLLGVCLGVMREMREVSPITYAHSLAVAYIYLCMVLESRNYIEGSEISGHDIWYVLVGGILHDSGKISGEKMLAAVHKKGVLNEEEREIMNSHPVRALMRLLHDIGLDGPDPLAWDGLNPFVWQAILGHHLDINGEGYPKYEDESMLHLKEFIKSHHPGDYEEKLRSIELFLQKGTWFSHLLNIADRFEASTLEFNARDYQESYRQNGKHIPIKPNVWREAAIDLRNKMVTILERLGIPRKVEVHRAPGYSGVLLSLNRNKTPDMKTLFATVLVELMKKRENRYLASLIEAHPNPLHTKTEVFGRKLETHHKKT